DVHARGILGPDAWLANDIRHWTNDTSVVRSGARPALHAAASAPRPLRGVRLRRAGAAGQWRAGRGARSARRLRRGRDLRSVEALAPVRGNARAGGPRLDPDRRP